MITDPVYIFSRSLRSFHELRRKETSLRGIWYDGKSPLIRDLFRYVQPARFYVEEGLEAQLARFTDGDRAPAPVVVSIGAEPDGSSKPFCMFPSNDTHVFLFQKLTSLSPRFQYYTSRLKKEGAERAIQQNGATFDEVHFNAGFPRQFSALLLGNDWAVLELLTLRRFQEAGVPTACLQESVINFSDAARRMEWADYPFVQGLITLNQLDSPLYFLTGNPRYEDLRILPPPSKDHVLINCNFTYGIHENQRNQWVKDCVDTTQELGLDYLISQHPRDRGDLSQYRVAASGASKVHDMIRDASVLVTRFSSLIHECLGLGRPVIYYNSYGERMSYDFEPDGENLFVATNVAELRAALDATRCHRRPDPEKNSFFTTYINRHCGSADGLASARVLQALETVSRVRPQKKKSPALRKRIRTRLSFYSMRLKAGLL